MRNSVRLLSSVTKTNKGKSSRKTVEFEKERLQTSKKENDDNLDQCLNIDNLPLGGLVYKTHFGNVRVRIPRATRRLNQFGEANM